MRALIDADIFLWEFGSATDSEFKPLAWPLVVSRIQGRIDGILNATGADTYQLYLTSEDKSNFRYKLATIRPYKGNRTQEKPYWYDRIRKFLIEHRGAIEVHGMEADDAVSIEQWKDYLKCKKFVNKDDIVDSLRSGFIYESEITSTVICSRDKDLDMVPGWHYSWPCGKQKEKELWWQDEISGLRCFYKQLLTGDSVDNISGLYGVGKSSSLLGRLDDCTDELSMFSLVYEQYEKRFGLYANQFILENGRLLWMKRSKDDEWTIPTMNNT